MEQPTGRHDVTDRVWRLKRADYGTPQAAREWFLTLSELIINELSCRLFDGESAVFIHVPPPLASPHTERYIFTHIDDFEIGGPGDAQQRDVDAIFARIPGKSSRECTRFLGMYKERDQFKCTITL